MSEKHGTLEAFGVIFACWAAVFFGVWMLPLPDFVRIYFDGFSTILFAIFGVSYFMLKGIIPFPKPESWRKANFFLDITIYLLMATISFSLNYITWEFTTVNGVQVVTYNNLISLIYGILGVVVIIFTIRYIRNRNPYKKRET